MPFLRRLHDLFRRREPSIAIVSEASVVEGFRKLEYELNQELREIAAGVRATEGVAYLIFDFRPCFAFHEFPISAFTYDAEGRECDCPVNGRNLLPGRHLLGSTGSYPIGRVDWLGIDTTPAAGIVERVGVQRAVGSRRRGDATAAASSMT